MNKIWAMELLRISIDENISNIIKYFTQNYKFVSQKRRAEIYCNWIPIIRKKTALKGENPFFKNRFMTAKR